MSRWLLAAASVLAIAVGAAILTGSILASDAEAASVRNAASRRAGRAAYAVSSRTFFHEQLADELSRTGGWRTCPIIDVDGATPSARWVKVYGVDERFWKFQGRTAPSAGSRITIRIDKPSPVPAETLFGPKTEEPLFLDTSVLEDPFSLAEGPDKVASVFVPYGLLQQTLNQPGRANRILISARVPESEVARIAEAVRERSVPDDVGVTFSDPEDGRTVVNSASIVMSDTLVSAITAAAQALGLPVTLTSSYKAQSIRAGDRAIPDSEIVADSQIEPNLIALDPAAARELRVKPGDQVTLDYQTWEDGHFIPATSVKWYQTSADQTAISLTDGQKLWGTRFGSITEIEATLRSPEIRGEDGLASFRVAVQKQLDPFQLGFSVRDLRPTPTPGTDFLEKLLICSALPVLAAFLLLRPYVDSLLGFVLPLAGTAAGVAFAPVYANLLLRRFDIGAPDFRPLSFLWGGLLALGLASFCILLKGRRLRLILAAIALIAVVSAQAFRARPIMADDVVADSRAPVIWNPGTPEGARALNLPAGPTYYAFRVRPGGDASALNPIKPKVPAILGAPESFLKRNHTEADVGSHFRSGDEIVIDGARVRISGTFQSYVIIPEASFTKAFPEIEGYRFFLAKGIKPSDMNTALAAYGINAEPASTRIARYKRVDDAWISLFQFLGSLAVVLFGISTIPLRAGKRTSTLPLAT
jgi:hypothetical protein